MKKWTKSKTIKLAVLQGGLSFAGVLAYLLSVLSNPEFVNSTIEFLGLFNVQVEGILITSIVVLLKSIIDIALRKITIEPLV